jgi:hypothetical protein
MANAVAVLSAGTRDVWAQNRARLRASSAVNCEALDMVDRAVYVLALDDTMPADTDALVCDDAVVVRWMNSALI